MSEPVQLDLFDILNELQAFGSVFIPTGIQFAPGAVNFVDATDKADAAARHQNSTLMSKFQKEGTTEGADTRSSLRSPIPDEPAITPIIAEPAEQG